MGGFPDAFENWITPGMETTEKCTFPVFQKISMDSHTLKAFGGPQTQCSLKSLLCLRTVIFQELSLR